MGEKESPQDILEMPFAADVEQKLMASLRKNFEFRPTLHVPPASLFRIIDSVRNTVLSWAMKLEEDGILGEGLTFTTKEIQMASEHTYNVNVFYGSVDNSQIQQDTTDSKQKKQ